jgi:hypothetical protein
MKALRKAIGKYKPDVILLQEIHGFSETGTEYLRSFTPNYNWSLNWGPHQKRGVGVGVRNNVSTPFPLNKAYQDEKGTLIAVDFAVRGRDCRAISIYRPSKTPIEVLLDPHWGKFSTHRDLVVARDFNIDKEAKAFHPFRDSMEDKGLTRIDWDSPTHWQGGNIDHIFVSSSIPEETKAITAIPTQFKDHLIMAGGVIGKSIKTSSHLKRLPEYVVKDPEFRKEVLERVGNYDGEPMAHLQRVKDTAWEVWDEWKGRSEISQRFKRLWELQVLRSSLAQRASLPRPKDFSPLLEEVTAATVNKYQIKKGRPWRKIILPKAIATCDEWIEYWEGQLGIPTPGKFLMGKKRAAKAQVKGILVREGVVIRNKEEVNKRMLRFWGKLFGTIRDYNPEILKRLISKHGAKFPKVPHRTVSTKEVIRLLTRKNKSCAGPDGIPFTFYRHTASTMAPMWRDLIQEAGEAKAWPKEFFITQLVLLPKVDTGFPAVEEFRPICITNSDYRIVVRYWALWFSEIENKVVLKNQHALLPGRRIDDAIEIIHDGFMEAIVDQPKVSLLQTDFFKAFDYVNREALLHTLKEMEAHLNRS